MESIFRFWLHVFPLIVDMPEVKLSLGSTLNPMEIKEGTDVYFECKIQANPKASKLAWVFNVSYFILLFVCAYFLLWNFVNLVYFL